MPAEPEAVEATVVAEDVAVETPEPSDCIEENRPLTFELKLAQMVAGDAASADEFMETNGISYESLQELEIGIGLHGTIKDRLAIPICSKDDEFVAYCDRYVGLLSGSDELNYKFPSKFRKDFGGVRLERGAEFRACRSCGEQVVSNQTWRHRYSVW